jgi:hypothetical protein
MEFDFDELIVSKTDEELERGEDNKKILGKEEGALKKDCDSFCS